MQKSSEISELRNELSCTVIYCSYIKISLLEIGKEGNFFYTQTDFMFVFPLPPFSFPEREEETFRRKIIGFPTLRALRLYLHHKGMQRKM